MTLSNIEFSKEHFGPRSIRRFPAHFLDCNFQELKNYFIGPRLRKLGRFRLLFCNSIPIPHRGNAGQFSSLVLERVSERGQR